MKNNGRKIKNIVMITVLIILMGLTCFTMYKAQNTSTSNSNNMEMSGQGNNMGAPLPNGNGGPGGGNSNSTPPEKPGNSNSNMTEPPEKPGESSTNSNSNSNSIVTDDNTNSDNSNGQPPAMPGDSSNTQSSDVPGGISNGNSQSMPSDVNGTSNNTISITYYVIFGIESLVIAIIITYLVMSRFNKRSFKETMKSSDKLIICVLSSIVLGGLLIGLEAYVTKNVLSSNSNSQMQGQLQNNQNNSTSVESSGKLEVEDTQNLSDKSYETSENDESVILVKNGGNLTLKNSKVTKSGGDSSNTENSEFYGINSGILVTKSSTATISNSTISTNAKGSNAVFATGEDAKIYITDSTITTTGESSARGLDATYGGYIKADNVKITTQGGSCATLATDRGEGTVIANNSTLETNGSGSPVIYSTGDISIENTKGVANGSQMVVIEGKNSATVTNSTLSASGKGNRGTTDQAGIMIYQSMSGDASEGTGTFTVKNSSLTINSSSDYYKSAPMFFITNTDAKINLENTKLSYGSNVLISAKGTSEWGDSGSNGGNLTLTATNQDLVGNIEVDKISTLKLALTSKSSYKGTINANNTAKKITLKIDKNSTITLTGDSYVTSLEDSDSSYSNINFNGYKLYVNGKAIN